MAVAYNNGDTRQTSGGTTVSFSFTTAGSDIAILVGARSSNGFTVSGVTYAGVSLTQLANSGVSMKAFGLGSANSGANNVAVTCSSYEFPYVNTASFNGVDGTTPFDTAVTNSGTSAAPSTGSVTCPTDGAVWGTEFNNYTGSGSITATAGTLIGSQRSGGTGQGWAHAYRLSTGAITFSIPGSAAWWAAGVPINPSAASGQGVGTASFTFTASGVGSSVANSSGTASFTFTPTGVGASTATSAGSATVTFNATGVGTASATGTGTASFVFTATGVGASSTSGQGVGTADVVFSASAVGQSTAASIGSASFVFNATAVGANSSGAGAASFTFTATGVGTSGATSSGVGTASFTFDAVGYSQDFVYPAKVALRDRHLTNLALEDINVSSVSLTDSALTKVTITDIGNV